MGTAYRHPGEAKDLGISGLDRAKAVATLERSDSFAAAGRTGEAIMIPDAGNDLRDLFPLARG
jgi:hypothetical protein